MENHLKNAATTFKAVTKYPIFSYLERFVNFYDTYRDDVLSFFDGSGEFNQDAFDELVYLTDESTKLNRVWNTHKSSFRTVLMWDFYEYIQTVRKQILTLSNAGKWLRSSQSVNSYIRNGQVQYTIRQNETMITIADRIANRQDPLNDWTDVAVKNDLNEEKYTREGDVLLNIELQGRTTNFKLESVVDIINGKSVYGKDIDQNITYLDNDLKVLSYDDTLKQSADILLSLRKGDNPQFRDSGITGVIGVSQNLQGILFPSLYRQISDLFSSDDSFKSIILKDVGYEKDGVFYQFEVETVIGDVLSTKTIL